MKLLRTRRANTLATTNTATKAQPARAPRKKTNTKRKHTAPQDISPDA